MCVAVVCIEARFSHIQSHMFICMYACMYVCTLCSYVCRYLCILWKFFQVIFPYDFEYQRMFYGLTLEEIREREKSCHYPPRLQINCQQIDALKSL